MSLQEKRQHPTLAEIARFPAAYVLVFMVGVGGFLLRGFSGQSQARTDDCKEQLKICQEKVEHKDSLIEEMAFQIRVQQSTIQQLPSVADSVLRHN